MTIPQTITTAMSAEASSKLLTTKEAAAYLALSAKSLERYRGQLVGPRYIKLGEGLRARVRYRKCDLDQWLAENTVGSSANAVEKGSAA